MLVNVCVQSKATVGKADDAKPTKAKTSKAPKYEELPVIPDYERVELEKFEKPEFDKTVKPKVSALCSSRF